MSHVNALSPFGALDHLCGELHVVCSLLGLEAFRFRSFVSRSEQHVKHKARAATGRLALVIFHQRGFLLALPLHIYAHTCYMSLPYNIIYTDMRIMVLILTSHPACWQCPCDFPSSTEQEIPCLRPIPMCSLHREAFEHHPEKGGRLRSKYQLHVTSKLLLPTSNS